jgi:hypothetical protein
MLENGVIVKFLLTGIKWKNIIFLKSVFQYSIIPISMPELKNISLKKAFIFNKKYKLVRFAHNWNNGMMGLKEFFTIKMVYFRLYPQYSSIPAFHSGGINRLPLMNLYFQEVVEFPRRKFMKR